MHQWESPIHLNTFQVGQIPVIIHRLVCCDDQRSQQDQRNQTEQRHLHGIQAPHCREHFPSVSRLCDSLCSAYSRIRFDSLGSPGRVSPFVYRSQLLLLATTQCHAMSQIATAEYHMQ